MSTIWELASRRPSLISTEQPEVDHPNNLAAILEEARARIPFIPSSNLKFDSFLGKGACFEVSRELYARTGVEDFQPFYVAVKHIVTHNVPGYDLEVPYASVRREIQVLTHAGFKNAPNIISLLGYGMAEYPGTLSPYLVVEYSEEGHLSDFLRAARWSKDPPRSLERCELALDIATGLKTLHENHIIHGDLKLANILVFPYAGIPAVREFQAKLADFGAAIVEHEAQASKYTGTLIYNAPEQRDYRLKAKYCSARRFYQADVWSFGLALVEVMDQGKRYLKAEWKNGDESDYEFLDRVFAEEHDGLLERTCHDEPDDGMANVHSAVIETLRITLRDDPETRASMDEVVDTLSVIFSKAISTQEPHVGFFAPRISPPPRGEKMLAQRLQRTPDVSLKHRLRPRLGATYKFVDALISSENLRWKGQDQWDTTLDPNKSALVLASRPTAARKSPLELTERDCFQLDPQSLPWNLQVDIVESLLKQTKTVGDDLEYHAQCAKLAFCYHVGFGVKPNRFEMFRLLGLSARANDQAKYVFQRLWAAIGSEEIVPEVDIRHGRKIELSYLEASNDVTYYSTRCRMSWRADTLLQRPDIESLLCPTGPNQHEDKPSLVSNALYVACSSGDFETAITLCSVCEKYELDEERPTPLHWLVMFEKRQLQDLGRNLASGPCRGLINIATTVGRGVFTFPKHCLRLSGSPLHWAIRTRNLAMVCLLLDLDADINQRWRGTQALLGEVENGRSRFMSPLDIAVQLHLPEIVNELLIRGAERVGGVLHQAQHSALSCFGYNHDSYTHYLIHGSQYREAACQTLGVLMQHGFDIQEVDACGYDALMIALCDADNQAYVIEELLGAGATADKKIIDDYSNAATIATMSSVCRKHTTSLLALIAPCVDAINDANISGWNALHYACIGGNSDAVEILIQQPGFDINIKDSKGRSALHLAALRNWPELIDTLVRHGIPLDVQDGDLVTPLENAAFSRQLRSIDHLLDSGADSIFADSRSILHVATARAPDRNSIVRYLLENHDSLRSPRIIDHRCQETNMTALHEATLSGDYSAVEALLFYGANRNTAARHNRHLLGKPIDFAIATLESIESGIIYRTNPFPTKRGSKELKELKASVEAIKDLLEDIDE